MELQGPKGLPFIGVGLQFSPQWLVKTHAKYGDTFRLDIPLGGGGIMVVHPDDVHAVLVNRDDHFRKLCLKDNPQSLLTRLVGNGLFGSTGNDWARQRKLMQPSFQPKQVLNFFDMIIERINHLFAGFDAKEGESINLHSAMIQITMDVITYAILSSAIDDEERPQVYRAIYQAISSIRPGFDPPLSPIIRRRFNRSLTLLDDLIYGIIDERQASPDANVPTDNLFTMLLNAKDEETGQGMSREQIRDELFTLFLAGHETTGATMVWCIYTLCQHPEIYQKVVDEIDTVLQGQKPSIESLNNLTYTKMVLYETLRLHPVAWLLIRVAQQDTVLGNYSVPERRKVFLSPYATHRHPDFWEKPESFYPEHFASETSHHKYAYIPFGGGKRVCIGNHLALLETQLILIMLLQRYQVELLNKRPVPLRPGLALTTGKPIFIRLHRR